MPPRHAPAILGLVVRPGALAGVVAVVAAAVAIPQLGGPAGASPRPPLHPAAAHPAAGAPSLPPVATTLRRRSRPVAPRRLIIPNTGATTCYVDAVECSENPCHELIGSQPAPAVTTPAVATPAVATPAVATPAVATPAVVTPAVATPAVATPAVVTPAVTVAPATPRQAPPAVTVAPVTPRLATPCVRATAPPQRVALAPAGAWTLSSALPSLEAKLASRPAR